MTDETRRTALKYALGLAAGAATMTSFLDRAYGQEGQGRMELSGGGQLMLERGDDGLWTARVLGPDGEERHRPTGLVHTTEAGAIALSEGRVVDGTVRAGGFSQHNQHNQHTETTSGRDGRRLTLEPDWRLQPVLPSQQDMLRETGALGRFDLEQQVRPQRLERPQLQEPRLQDLPQRMPRDRGPDR